MSTIADGVDAVRRAAREELRKVGLHPDNGYLYGSAWLKEEVPTEVLAYLHALPESKLTPAWV